LLTPPGSTGEIDNPWDVDFGVTIQVKSPQGMSFYFGPVVYWQPTEFRFEGTAGASDSTPLKEKSNFGGFMAARLPLLYPEFNIEVGGQYKNGFSLGGLISYSF
jgi:hypothetical protein